MIQLYSCFKWKNRPKVALISQRCQDSGGIQNTCLEIRSLLNWLCTYIIQGLCSGHLFLTRKQQTLSVTLSFCGIGGWKTHLGTAVPAELLVDLINWDWDVLKALAESIISPSFHLFKLLPTYSGFLSAGFKS